MTTTLPAQPAPTPPTPRPGPGTRLRVGVLTTSATLHAVLARQCTAAGHPPIVHATPRVYRSNGDPEADRERLAAIAGQVHGTPVVSAHARELATRLDKFDLDVLVAYGYPTLVPPDALATPRVGVLNLHSSRLPDLRGAAPVPAAILRGDRELWGTAHLMDARYDAGPVVVQRPLLELPAWCTYDEGHETITEALVGLLPTALALLARGFAGTRQDEGRATYAELPPEADRASIDLARPVAEVQARMRFARWMGRTPHTRVHGHPYRLGRPHLRPGPGRTPIPCANAHLWVEECTPILDHENAARAQARPSTRSSPPVQTTDAAPAHHRSAASIGGSVSVDGPNASGKTTLMLGLARAFRVPGLDTGPTYRAAAAYAIPQGVPPADLARHLTVVVRPGLPQRLLWRGVDTLDDDLFGPRASANISQVAGDPQWREAIRAIHAQVCARHRDIVVVGRDVAPTLLPDATLSVFLDADPQVRRARRELQWADHPERPVHVDALSPRDLATRAWITEHRPQARRLDLDTTTMRIDEVLDSVRRALPG
ncbi:(d)CMP kinase (plasmid) [Embleya sp. NBC_00888]|uniref:(d)CMP kinase n=1 Tax=Embleya sp. NBC_00888 TaxID=2975960 RepID=UPI002F915F72|nr:(d)CMP kinase [Embleya sp. NBC_00888]